MNVTAERTGTASRRLTPRHAPAAPAASALTDEVLAARRRTATVVGLLALGGARRPALRRAAVGDVSAGAGPGGQGAPPARAAGGRAAAPARPRPAARAERWRAGRHRRAGAAGRRRPLRDAVPGRRSNGGP